jgi:hypothetical protein
MSPTAAYDTLCALSEAALNLAAAIDEGRADPNGWNYEQFVRTLAMADTVRTDCDTLEAESLPAPQREPHISRPVMGVGQRGHGWAA